MKKPNPKTAEDLVVCLHNDGYEASLEVRKIYEMVFDADAQSHKQVRVVDESGEDYLYPASFFKPIPLPPRLRKAVLASVLGGGGSSRGSR